MLTETKIIQNFLVTEINHKKKNKYHGDKTRQVNQYYSQLYHHSAWIHKSLGWGTILLEKN